MPKDADEIWNRACLERGGTAPREGDIALAAAILVHGLVMNGGVLHAVGCLAEAEVLAACAGYRYFGFETVAPLLTDARLHVDAGRESEDDLELRFNKAYAAAIHDDGVLVAAFERDFMSNESRYAPVDDGRAGGRATTSRGR